MNALIDMLQSWLLYDSYTFTIYVGLIAFFLVIFNLTALSNLIFFPRLKPSQNRKTPSQKVSILIPARNEAHNIATTIQDLYAQTSTNFEIILLDDQSTDGTTDVAQSVPVPEGVTPIRVLAGTPLPADWLGKNWACHQLSQAASGQLLLFADADVRWRPDAVETLLKMQASSQSDLLTAWPTQITLTTTEKLVVPLMKFAIVSYLPLLGVHYLPFAAFAAANGQCLLFERQAYDKIGGHTAVRGDIIEDVRLAQLIKQAGARLRMTDGGHLISCRMYEDWQSVKQGFGKNILAGHGNSVPFLAVSTIFHLSAFVLPWVWMIAAPSIWAAGLIGLGLLLRTISALHAADSPRQFLLGVFGFPLSVLLMTRIALQAVQWHFGQGPEWKGRTITAQSDQA